MMSTGNPTILAAIIAASAAFGAALFAFAAALINAKVARNNAVMQAVIAQKMKLAEFRQAWIKDLRESFTKMQVSFMFPETDRDGGENAIRLLLLMNRNDPDYQSLRHSIHLLTNRKNEDAKAVEDARRQLIITCQAILKREWEITKSELRHLEDEARAMLSGKPSDT